MATKPAIQRVADEHRARLLKQDAATARQMALVYAKARRAIKERLTELEGRIATARAAGEEVGPAWLLREARYHKLLADADAAMRRFSREAGILITGRQEALLDEAQDDAERYIATAQGPPPPGAATSFDRLPEEAITELVPRLAPGSPLYDVLADFAPNTVQGVSDTLLNGMALGLGMDVVARQIAQLLDGGQTRAFLIARTETLRAYREALRRTYQANDDIVGGWRWTAHKSIRTCAACLSLDGSIHDLDEPMGTHPACRCTQTPMTKSWRELGFDVDEPPDPYGETGSEWLAKQPANHQDLVLGKAGGAAYRAGKVTLADFVQVRHSPVWGTTRSVKSAKAMGLGGGESGGSDGSGRRRGSSGGNDGGDHVETILRRLRAASRDDVVQVSATPRPLISAWPKAHAIMAITGERRDHYLELHPEMSELEADLIRALIDPDLIYTDARDKGTAVVYRALPDAGYLRAVVRMSETEELYNSVITAYRRGIQDYHGHRGDGRLVWRKPGE